MIIMEKQFIIILYCFISNGHSVSLNRNQNQSKADINGTFEITESILENPHFKEAVKLQNIPSSNQNQETYEYLKFTNDESNEQKYNKENRMKDIISKDEEKKFPDKTLTKRQTRHSHRHKPKSKKNEDKLDIFPIPELDPIEDDDGDNIIPFNNTVTPYPHSFMDDADDPNITESEKLRDNIASPSASIRMVSHLVSIYSTLRKRSGLILRLFTRFFRS